MFSSVICPSSSLTLSFNVFLKIFTISSISITLNSISRFSASNLASTRDSSVLYLEGNATPITLSEPRASTAIDAVKAESIPPESPTRTFSKLFLLT